MEAAVKTKAMLALTAALTAWAGPSAATIVESGPAKAELGSGGIEVSPSSRNSRLECWRDGQRVVDAIDRDPVSMGLASRAGRVVVRLSDGKSATVSLGALSETYCIVTPRD